MGIDGDLEGVARERALLIAVELARADLVHRVTGDLLEGLCGEDVDALVATDREVTPGLQARTKCGGQRHATLWVELPLMHPYEHFASAALCKPLWGLHSPYLLPSGGLRTRSDLAYDIPTFPHLQVPFHHFSPPLGYGKAEPVDWREEPRSARDQSSSLISSKTRAARTCGATGTMPTMVRKRSGSVTGSARRDNSNSASHFV